MSGTDSAISSEKTYTALKLWRECLRVHAIDLLQSSLVSPEERTFFRKNLLLLGVKKSDTSQKPSGLPNSATEFTRILSKEPPASSTTNLEGRIARNLLTVSISWEILQKLRARGQTPVTSRSPEVLLKIDQCRFEMAPYLGRGILGSSLERILQILLDTLNEAETEIKSYCQQPQYSESVTANEGNWLFEHDGPTLGSAGARFVAVLANFWPTIVGPQPMKYLEPLWERVLTAVNDSAEPQEVELSPPLFSVVVKLLCAVTIIAANAPLKHLDVSRGLLTCWLDLAPADERESWLLRAINSLVAAPGASIDRSSAATNCAQLALETLLNIQGSENVLPRIKFSDAGVPIPDLTSLTTDEIQFLPVDDEQAAQHRFVIRCRMADSGNSTAAVREPLLSIFLAKSVCRDISEAWSKLRNLNHPPLDQQFLECCTGFIQRKNQIAHPSDWILRRNLTAEQLGIGDLIQRLKAGQIKWEEFSEFLVCCRLQIFPPLQLQTGEPEVPADLRDYPNATVRYSENLSDTRDVIANVRYGFARSQAAFDLIKAVPEEYRSAAAAFDNFGDSVEARSLLKQLVALQTSETTTTSVDILQRLADIILKAAGKDGNAVHEQMLAAIRSLGRRFSPALTIHPEQFRFGQKLYTWDLQGSNTKPQYEYSQRERGVILGVEKLVVTSAGSPSPLSAISVSAGSATENFEAALTAIKRLPPKIHSEQLQRLLQSLPEKETTQESKGYDIYLEIYRLIWPDDLSVEEVQQHEQDPSLTVVRNWFSSAVAQRALFRVTPARSGDYLRGSWRKGETYIPVNENHRATVVKCMLRPLLQEVNNTTVEMAQFYVHEV